MDPLVVHWNMNPEIFRIGGFAVRWYGLLFVSGFILGYWMFTKFFEREKVNKDLLDPLLYTLLLGTLVGARLGHCLFYGFDYYFTSWKGFLEIFKKDDGGRVSCVFSEFQTRVNRVAFCGDMLAVSHESGKLMICDMSKGTVVKVFGTDGYYTEMVFSPSGEQLMGIAYSRDHLDVLSVSDGLLFTMRAGEAFSSFAFTEDGSKAVGITASGYVAGDLFTDEDALIKRAEKLAGR